MPIRKKGNIDIQTSAKGAQATQTGYTFYSYDKNSAALYFEFNDQNGQPTDLKKATVRLVMILNDDDKKNASVMTKAEIISELRGTAKYDIPESLLGYEGKVTGYVYLEFEDGSHTDEGRFIFNIKRSMISNVLPEVGDKYVQDFEDVKERVEQAGDSATKDIKQAKDNAESQIGDYVGEVESAKDSTIEDIDKALPEVVESAKQDISSSVSDVQSKASEASESIDEASKEVNTAKAEAIKNMHESDISDKNYLLDSRKRVLEPGTSSTIHTSYYLSDLIPAGTEFTISGKLEITDGGFDKITILFKDENGASGGHSDMEISDNEFSKTFTLSKTLHKISVYAGQMDGTQGNGVIYTDVKLQTGPLATPWNPNPHEIVTQDQYEKLANAITSLGGSV